MVSAVTTACALLVVSAAAAATPPHLWMRTAGTVSVSVDRATFAYSATLSAETGASGANCGGFQGGGVSLRCEGVHYTTGAVVGPSDGHLSLAGPAQEDSGVDSLGTYDSIGADFQGGSSAACALHTEIRYYGDTASFVFVADFSEDGVPGTNSTTLLSPEPPAAGPVDLPGLSTSFPSWPAGSMGKECMYYSYQGNSLGGNWRAGALSQWSGGLQAGPLLLYPAASTAPHPPAMLISPLTHAKSTIGSPGAKTTPSVSFGVQGYVEELPAGFSSAVVLIGRPGIAATQMAWGEAVRRKAATRRLTLDKDILNSKVTYWTDNGAYYCYCNTFRRNPDRRVPMHVTIKALKAYHNSIGLHIDMYHLDSGFWHSAHADGHCDGVTAANWSASEFHWPHVDQIGDGLGEKVWGEPGAVDAVSWQMLYMGLAGSKFRAARPRWAGGENATGNVYGDGTYDVVRPQGGPWPMIDDTFGGQQMGQVHYTHAHTFWDSVMGYGYRENNLRSLVIDLLQDWFLNFHDRTNNTHRHETWMDGYFGPSGGVGDGGASKYGLPVRVDQALPSDHLASAVLNWPAVVSARIGGDMDGGQTWSQMGSTGAFLSALQIRPIMDVLWTQSVMPDNTEHLPFRKYIDHELIIALLTCGPVGFGDSLPNKGFLGTNVTKLLQTSRLDGVLLKPAHTALRLDVAPPNPGGPPRAGFDALEVWAAAAVPSRPSAVGYSRIGAAGLLSAATDRRANSLVRLAHVNGSADAAERWWYTLLATDVSSNDNSTAATIAPAMLFPTPPADLSFVVSTFGTPCHDGGAASSCLSAFTPSSPIPVETEPCPGGRPGCRNWKILSVAPVLAGGWAIIGEESKYVALSPQRIVAAHTTKDSTDPDASDALLEGELVTGAGADLAFSIIGATNEAISITVVAPGPAAGPGGVAGRLSTAMAGKIVLVKTTLGESGEASVRCSAGACKVA